MTTKKQVLCVRIELHTQCPLQQNVSHNWEVLQPERDHNHTVNT